MLLQEQYSPNMLSFIINHSSYEAVASIETPTGQVMYEFPSFCLLETTAEDGHIPSSKSCPMTHLLVPFQSLNLDLY